MIRILLDRAFDNERHYIHAVGLSTDTKPTDVKNGSTLVEIDTGKGYLFDADSKAWKQIPQGSSVVINPASGVSF
jgi:hypothetical protein